MLANNSNLHKINKKQAKQNYSQGSSIQHSNYEDHDNINDNSQSSVSISNNNMLRGKGRNKKGRSLDQVEHVSTILRNNSSKKNKEIVKRQQQPATVEESLPVIVKPVRDYPSFPLLQPHDEIKVI